MPDRRCTRTPMFDPDDPRFDPDDPRPPWAQTRPLQLRDVKTEDDLLRFRRMRGIPDSESYPRWLTCVCHDPKTGVRGGAVCATHAAGGAYCNRCGALL